MQVVYMPACVTRMMGPSISDDQQESVHEKLLSLFEKGGYEVIYPKGLSSQCCGMMFNSRGLKEAAVAKGADLEAALMEASEGGKIPIVCDTSPCLSQVGATSIWAVLHARQDKPGQAMCHSAAAFATICQ